VALAVPSFTLDGGEVIDDLSDRSVQVGHQDGGTQIRKPPAHVSGDEVKNTLGDGGEAPDGQTIVYHDDGHIDAGQQVDQVIVEVAQFEVAILQFFVEGTQLFVSRLEFF